MIEWAPNLPHMEVRRFIAEILRKKEPSKNIDIIVCNFLDMVSDVPCTQYLDAAIGLIPDGWWWHMSHLEVVVIPTYDVPNSPVSNSKLYDFFGKPVGYSAMCWDRKELPVALCEALLKARYDLPTAFYVEASKKEELDYRNRVNRLRYKHVEEIEEIENDGC